MVLEPGVDGRHEQAGDLRSHAVLELQCLVPEKGVDRWWAREGWRSPGTYGAGNPESVSRKGIDGGHVNARDLQAHMRCWYFRVWYLTGCRWSA